MKMSRIPDNAPCVIDINTVFIWSFYQTKKLAQFNCDKLNKNNDNPHYIVTTYANYVNEQENRRSL